MSQDWSELFMVSFLYLMHFIPKSVRKFMVGNFSNSAADVCKMQIPATSNVTDPLSAVGLNAMGRMKRSRAEMNRRMRAETDRYRKFWSPVRLLSESKAFLGFKLFGMQLVSMFEHT